jgi:hypothetical protein
MDALGPVEIRYAKSDEDIVAIHKFLCHVAGPTLPGPIAAKESIEEIWRCVNHDVALMAIRGPLLVGTFGIINPAFWWNNKIKFLANRWLFVIPDSHALLPLVREGVAIAKASDLELHVYDEAKGRLLIFNKSKNRN